MFEFDIDTVPKVTFKDTVKIKTTRGLLDTNYKTELTIVSQYRPERELYVIVEYGSTIAEAESAAKARAQEIIRRAVDGSLKQREDYLANLIASKDWEAELKAQGLDPNLQIFHLTKGDSNDE